jgi:prepilin-type N-terminal cleavage/methylation domain-containing protein
MNARGGFSLIELLCTVAIMLILTVLIAGHGSASTDKRARIGCEKNLEKIYLALSLYASDNQGHYPFLAGATNAEGALSLLVPRSTTTTEIFICPGSKDKELPEAESFASAKISYAYYTGRSTNDDSGAVLVSDWQVNDLAKTAGQQLFSPDGKKPGNNHGKTGGNLLQAGGSVQFSTPIADRDLPLSTQLRLLNPK